MITVYLTSDATKLRLYQVEVMEYGQRVKLRHFWTKIEAIWWIRRNGYSAALVDNTAPFVHSA